MEQFLLISVGAILGANLRFWVADWAVQRFGASFPFGTLIINLTGTLILSIFFTIATERLLLDPRWRVFVAVGFCGSYTTFSTFSYESVNLMMRGQFEAGLLNLFGSAFLGGLVVVAGILIGRLI